MEEKLKLENQLCFKFYAISKEIIRLYKPLLDPLDLTYTAYITMLALWEEDRVTISKLGQRLTLDSGTLTPLLKKLEKKGYVQRVRSSEDERKVNIVLTKDGRSLYKDAKDIPDKIIERVYKGHEIEDNDIKKSMASLDAMLKMIRNR